MAYPALSASRQTGAAEQATLNAAYGRLARAAHLLPIKVTAFYRAKLEEELAALGHTDGPLHRIVYPSAERMAVRAPGEVKDFVDDRSNMAPGGRRAIVQKYADRVLFLATPVCAAHCQYCFRQDVLTQMHGEDPVDLDEKLEALAEHVGRDPAITEVILSGGDPLTLSAAARERVLARLRALPSSIRSACTPAPWSSRRSSSPRATRPPSWRGPMSGWCITSPTPTRSAARWRRR